MVNSGCSVTIGVSVLAGDIVVELDSILMMSMSPLVLSSSLFFVDSMVGASLFL